MRDYKTKLATMKSCRRYIEEHLQEEMDLVSLARRCNWSYTPFMQNFKEMTGYTPHQYIRLRRVQLAAQLMREGHEVKRAGKAAGFDSYSGLYKAFCPVYGMSPQEFAGTRGMALMKPPDERELSDFFLVGYVLEPDPTFMPKDMGAYWMIQTFPDVSSEEYFKIGGGEDSVAAWIRDDLGERYLFGPHVKEVLHVPEHMEAYAIPGGLFLEFPVPETKNSLILYENFLVTWYYARVQWIPASELEEDTERIAFEYYSGEKNSVLIPVRRKEEQEPKTE